MQLTWPPTPTVGRGGESERRQNPENRQKNERNKTQEEEMKHNAIVHDH